MRAIALAALGCALLVTGCSNPCQELGDRLCDCRPAGTTKASCSQQVSAEIDRLHIGGDTKSACSRALDECHEPSDVSFCDWLEGRCGKAACGLSQEDVNTLKATPVDASCTPSDTTTCEMICH